MKKLLLNENEVKMIMNMRKKKKTNNQEIVYRAKLKSNLCSLDDYFSKITNYLCQTIDAESINRSDQPYLKSEDYFRLVDSLSWNIKANISNIAHSVRTIRKGDYVYGFQVGTPAEAWYDNRRFKNNLIISGNAYKQGLITKPVKYGDGTE